MRNFARKVPSMKLYFLGTGTSTGVPHIGCQCKVCQSTDRRDQRTRSSALLHTDEGRLLLLDCGPDFRTQMLRFLDGHPESRCPTLPYRHRQVEELSLEQAQALGLDEGMTHHYALPMIDAVLLTHEHFDHVGGLDDLRPFSIFHPIDICCEPRVAAPILQHMHYCFRENPYPGSPKLTMRPLESLQPFVAGGVEIVPLRVLHGKLPIVGYRIGPLAYITDMSTMPDSEWGKLRGVRTLVTNALRHAPHGTHQTLQQAITFAQRVGAERTYFIHQSHGAGTTAESEKWLPQGMVYAYDGLEIDV